MKLRTLIKRAYEIIQEEHDNVMAEFQEDDGSITDQNFIRGTVLKKKYAAWMADAAKVIDVSTSTPRRKRKAPQKQPKKKYNIVVQK